MSGEPPAQEWTPEQLIRIDIQQALEPDFVADQTRSLEDANTQSAASTQPSNNSSQTSTDKDDEKNASNEKDVINGWMSLSLTDPAASISSLLSTVKSESATEHLTAGLRQTVSADEGQDVLARLARQLAALGLSADTSYQTLAYRRMILCKRLYDAYVTEFKSKQLSTSRFRKLPQSKLHALLVLGIKSGVHVALSLLQSSATNNPALCWKLLGFLNEQLESIPTLSFSLNSSSLPHPELSNSILNAIQSTLFQLCQPDLTSEANKSLSTVSSSMNDLRSSIGPGALDLMLSLAVARGCLPDLLTIVKLLFLRAEASRSSKEIKSTVEMYSSLSKLQKLEKLVVLDLPSQARLHQSVSVHELRYALTHSTPKPVPSADASVVITKQPFPIITANAKYLFVYCELGLFKLGTGNNPNSNSSVRGSRTLAGTIYAQVPKFKNGEEATMVCVNDRLYWRSRTMPVNAMLVIDCDNLTEVGILTLDGSGSVPSNDNTQAFLNSLLTKEPPPHAATSNLSRSASLARAPSLARPSSMPSNTLPAAATETPVPNEPVGFGRLISDGQLVYSLTKKPETQVQMNATVESTNDTAASAASSEVKEQEEKKDHSDSSDSESDTERGRPSRSKPVTTAKKVDERQRHPLLLHAFDPTNKFSLVHSTPLWRPRLKDYALLFPREMNSALFSTEAKDAGLQDDVGDIVEEDHSSDEDEDENESSSGFGGYGGAVRVGRRRDESPFTKKEVVSKSEKKSNAVFIALPIVPQLSFDEGSSFTFEVWLHSSNVILNDNQYRTILHRGTVSRNTFVYLSNRSIIAGSRGNTGLSLVKTSLDLDVTDWFHLAVTFDAVKKMWSIYINGNLGSTISNIVPGGDRVASQIFGSNIWTCDNVENEITHVMEQASQGRLNPNSSSSHSFNFPSSSDFGSPFGSSGGFGSSSARPSENPSGPTVIPPVSGPVPMSNTAWTLGHKAHGTQRFSGQMKDVRLWKSARTEEEIKQHMAVGSITALQAKLESDLVGAYALNEGIGLTLHDSSRFGSVAFVRGIRWVQTQSKTTGLNNGSSSLESIVETLGQLTNDKNAEQAISDLSQKVGDGVTSTASPTNGLIEQTPNIPYLFHISVNEAAMYCNGESLAIIYRPTLANHAYPSLVLTDSNSTTHMVQIFSIETGELKDEFEYKLPVTTESTRAAAPKSSTGARAPSARTFASTAPSSRTYPVQSSGGSLFSSSTATRSPFFNDDDFGGPSGGFGSSSRRGSFTSGPSTASAANQIPFLLSACVSPDAESVWIFTNTDTENFKQFTIRSPVIVSHWRAKTALQQKVPTTNEKALVLAPKQLRNKYPLQRTILPDGTPGGVELPVAIGQLLLSLHEQLDTIGAPGKKCPPSLIVPLAIDLSPETFSRLLDLTEHLVQDYYRSEKELQELYGPFIELRFFGLLVAIRLLKSNISHLVQWNVDPLKSFSPTGSDVQTRFSTVLNRLIFEQPTSASAQFVSSQLIEDVTAVLSQGMTIFYRVPARIEILLALVETALSPKVDEGTPLKVLLMNRYLAKLSDPDQIITLIPAFMDSKTVGDDATHPLLARIYQLVHRSTQAQLDAYFHRFKQSASANQVSTGVSTESTAALGFLKKLSICMLAHVSKPSATQPTSDHATQFILLLLKGSIQLLTSALNSIKQYSGDVRFDDIVAREKVMDILTENSFVLLQPLLSTTLLLKMNAPIASSLLPTFLETLQLLNALLSTVPSVIQCEREFIDGTAPQTVVRKSTQAESPHPVPGSNYETRISIPGATSMTISIDMSTSQCLSAFGTSLVIYRKPNCEDELARFQTAGFASRSCNVVKVTGDSVYVHFESQIHGGNNQRELYGFAVQAVASVPESRMKLPFLLDLAKSLALVAGRLSLVLVRGVYVPPESNSTKPSKSTTTTPAITSASPAPTGTPAIDATNPTNGLVGASTLVDKWINSELLSEGVEYDASKESAEESALSFLPVDPTAAENDSEPIDIDSLSLKRAGSYRLIDVSLHELAQKLDKKLASSDVKLPPFPIGAQVLDLVNRSIRAVMAVLLKQNMLVGETQQYLLDTSSNAVPTENLVRLWKAAYKMRGWILNRFQEQRNAIQKSVKPEDEEKQKIEIYTKICDQINSQCEFLLTVVPVPMRVAHPKTESIGLDAPASGAPTLIRQGSSATADSNASLSSKIVQAWNQSKSTISLKDANAEERFNLVWKHALNFISAEIDIPALEAALRQKRIQARMRSAGYRMVTRLINVCQFGCIKRELIACISPGLSASTQQSFDGGRGSLLQNCKPSNLHLERQTRAAFKSLYQALLTILQAGANAGTALLCSILHTFSLQYEQADLDLVVSLGIFPLLNTLLLSFSQPKVALTKPIVDGSTEPPTGQVDSKKVEDRSATAAQATYHAAFTLLDLFMSTLLTSSWTDTTQRSHMSAIHGIVEVQLANIARNLQIQVTSEATNMPQYLANIMSKSSTNPFARSLFQQQQSKKLIDSMDDDSSSNESTDVSRSNDEDVLNVIDKLVFLPAGRTRISEPVNSENVMLTSLIQILKLGSARARVVVLRILRRLCTSPQSPSLAILNQCFQRTATNEQERSMTLVDYLLRHIGSSLSTSGLSCITATEELISDPAIQSILTQLRLYQTYSNESVLVFAEEVMLIRCLAQSGSVAFIEAISTQISNHINQLPKILPELIRVRNERVDVVNELDQYTIDRKMLTNIELLEGYFRCLGSLAIVGGYSDTLRVGNRVKILAEGGHGTIVCLKTGADKISILRDEGEGLVNLPVEEVAPLADVPFNAGTLLKSLSPMTVLTAVTQIIQMTAILGTVSTNHTRDLAFTCIDQFLTQLRLRAFSVMYAYISIPTILAQLLTTNTASFLPFLFQVALNTNSTVDIAPVLDFRVNQIMMECIRRTTRPATIYGAIQVKAEKEEKSNARANSKETALVDYQLALSTRDMTVDVPQLSGLNVQLTCFGSNSPIPSVNSPTRLVYLPLDGSIKNVTTTDPIVAIDTYDSFTPLKTRILDLIRHGVRAIILCLHSSTVQAEGLTSQAVLDAEEKALKAKERQDAATRAATDVTAGAAARGRALRGESSGLFGGGGGFGGDEPEESETVDKKKEKEKVVVEKQTIDDLSPEDKVLIQSIPIVALNQFDSQILRGLLHIQDRRAPDRLHRTALLKRLSSLGFTKSQVARALKKANWNVEKAKEWLDTNRDWLMNQAATQGDDSDLDEEGEDGGQSGRGRSARVTHSRDDDEKDEGDETSTDATAATTTTDGPAPATARRSSTERRPSVRFGSVDAAPTPSPSTGGFGGASTNTPSGFGRPSGGFGTSGPSPASTGFGFGRSPAPSTAPTSTGFGAPSATPSSGGGFGFGAPSTGGFGSAPSATSFGFGRSSAGAIASGGTGFGAPSAATSNRFGGFSSGGTAPSAGFGNVPASNTESNSQFGSFGAPAPSSGGGGFGGFAAPSATSTSGFGSPPSASFAASIGYKGTTVPDSNANTSSFGATSGTGFATPSTGGFGSTPLNESKEVESTDSAAVEETPAEKAEKALRAAEAQKIADHGKTPEQLAEEAKAKAEAELEKAIQQKMADHVTPQPEPTESASTSGGFGFGRPSQSSEPRGPTGFGFGAAGSAPPRSSGPSLFGANPNPAPNTSSGGFGVGNNGPSAPPASSTPSRPMPTSGFLFSGPPPSESRPTPAGRTGPASSPAAASTIGGRPAKLGLVESAEFTGAVHPGMELLVGPGASIRTIQESTRWTNDLKRSVNDIRSVGLASTSAVLSDFSNCQYRLIIYFARKILCQMLAHWPKETKLGEFASANNLSALVHVCLALDGAINIAAEVQPEACLAGSDFRSVLLKCLRTDRQRPDSGYLSQVVLQSVTDVLSSANDPKSKPMLQVVSQPINGGESTPVPVTSRQGATTTRTNVIYEMKLPITSSKPEQRTLNRLEVPDVKALLIQSDASTVSEQRQYTINCIFYDDQRVERHRVILKSKCETANKLKVILPGAVSYFSLYTDDVIDQPIELSFKLTYVKRALFGLTLFGNLYVALNLLDVLVCEIVNQPHQIHRLTLLLLQILPHAPDKSVAQLCCTAAAKLFVLWKKNRSQLSFQEWNEIYAEIAKLETAYNVLRLQSMTNWNSVAPSQHMQILLELLLSARVATRGSDQYSADILARIKANRDQERLRAAGCEAPTPFLRSNYAKNREGDSSISLINLNKKEVVATGNTLKHSNQTNPNNSFGAFGGNSSGQRIDLSETYLAPIALKGGRWYYEVTIKEASPQMVLAIGWVTREYKFADRRGFEQDTSGQSWKLTMPGTYVHKAASFGDSDTIAPPTPLCTYVNGTVIGCWLDLDSKSMCWSFNGKIDKPDAFVNIPSNAVLYPVVGLGAGEIAINFGAQPFKYHPNEPIKSTTPSAPGEVNTAMSNFLSGHSPTENFYLPIEHPAVDGSSYLDTLDDSYALLQTLAERKQPLDDQTIQSAINQELTDLQQETPLSFEYVDCDETNSNYGFGSSKNKSQVLIDNSQTTTFSKGNNLHITFQLSDQGGASDTDSAVPSFLLRSIMIRAQKTNANSFAFAMNKDSNASVFGLVFLSMEKPQDYEMYEWCNDFKLPQYKRFVARKMAAVTEKLNTDAAGSVLPASPTHAQPTVTYLPHEPVGFISNSSGALIVNFHCDPANIRPARFVTLKLSTVHNQFQTNLEFIKFSGILSAHPLSGVVGPAATQAKISEIRQQLLAGAKECVQTVPSSPHEEKSESLLASPSNSSASRPWSLAQDESLIALIQTLSTRSGVAPSAFDCVGSFNPTSNDLSRYSNLQSVSVDAMRSRISILKYFNRLVAPLLPYCGMENMRQSFQGTIAEAEKDSAAVVPASPTNASSSSSGSSSEFDSSLSSTVRKLKGVYFLATKKAVFESLLAQQRTAWGGSASFSFAPSTYQAPRISVNRIRAARQREDGTSATLMGSVFHQIFNQLRSHPTVNFRSLAPDQQVWSVQFQGEGSIDVGGPFRESVSALSADLMSSATNLFILSPNGTNGVGLNRSTWLPNPSAASSIELQHFEFIGVLFGISLKTRFPLPLDLPSVVWKSLLDQKLDTSDLEAFDKLCVQALAEIKNFKSTEFASMFSEQKFTTQLSDHTEIELKPNGRTLPVTYDKREEFIRLATEARLHESEKQISAIKKGLNSVVPTNLLSLLTYNELALLICGDAMIDVEALRRHTVFNGLSPTDDVVVWLFKCLHSFNSEDRQLFLRFVWGRNRLPATDTDWVTKFTINRLSSAISDESLPVSHTCFFSIDLPAYSTYAILRKKVLYAIQNCQAIDVDFNPQANEQMAWVD